MTMTEVPPRPSRPAPKARAAADRTLPFGFVAVALMSTVAIVAALLAVAFAAARLNDHSGGTAGAQAVSATGATKTFDIELGDMFVKPGSITVDAGDKVVLNVMNDGAIQHDLKLNGTTGTPLLDPGGMATADLGVITADSQAWCTQPGHKAAGMVLDIKVRGGSTAAATASTTGAAAAGANANDAKVDPNATPGPGWKPFDPTLQPAAGGTVHNVSFDATETVLEVAPGVTQQMWTFNGQVPGPVLRGRVGDVFNVTLTNKGKMGHSIDFHASQTSMDVNMRTLQPGESLVYQFKADYAGVWMYHCGTAPILHHIGNGMFGAVIIDPPVLDKVDHEYVFVQSELYTGPQGQPGDLAKMQTESFDGVMFNGYVNQYKYSPIKVNPGDRIRAYVLDAGPNENSSFHIVGTIFDTVYKEGAYLLQKGNANQGGSQALDLQPAQGGFVELTIPEAGTYTMVTHKFANVGKGGVGLIKAGDTGTAMSH